jgi:sugar/nucleoside kinase (ribokinase family)
MKRYDLIVIGDLVADIIMPVNKLPLRPDEHDWADGLFTELGGSCTTLVAARRVNLDVSTLGILGDDSYGRQVTQMLEDEGVDVSHIWAGEDRKTVLCVVVTDKAGQHVFLGIKDHKPPERCPREWQEVILQARSLFTTGYTLRDLLHPEDSVKLLRIGKSNNIPVFFDPGPSIEFIPDPTLKEALRATEVLLLTAEEAQFLVDGEGAEGSAELLNFGPSVVVLKMGGEGCLVTSAEGTIHHPGFDIDVVDTVGAGDSFVAAFIAGYLRGGDLRDCAALGNAMGAAVASTQGAGRNVPDAGRLMEILRDDPAAGLISAAAAT